MPNYPTAIEVTDSILGLCEENNIQDPYIIRRKIEKALKKLGYSESYIRKVIPHEWKDRSRVNDRYKR